MENKRKLAGSVKRSLEKRILEPGMDYFRGDWCFEFYLGILEGIEDGLVEFGDPLLLEQPLFSRIGMLTHEHFYDIARSGLADASVAMDNDVVRGKRSLKSNSSFRIDGETKSEVAGRIRQAIEDFSNRPSNRDHNKASFGCFLGLLKGIEDGVLKTGQPGLLDLPTKYTSTAILVEGFMREIAKNGLASSSVSMSSCLGKRVDDFPEAGR